MGFSRQEYCSSNRPLSFSMYLIFFLKQHSSVSVISGKKKPPSLLRSKIKLLRSSRISFWCLRSLCGVCICRGLPSASWLLSSPGTTSSPSSGQSGSRFVTCQPFLSSESRRQRRLKLNFYQPGCQSLLSKRGCFLQGFRSGLWENACVFTWILCVATSRGKCIARIIAGLGELVTLAVIDFVIFPWPSRLGSQLRRLCLTLLISGFRLVPAFRTDALQFSVVTSCWLSPSRRKSPEEAERSTDRARISACLSL